MKDDVLARQLHDRVTRGEALTEAEQATLEAWYERQDAEEATQFAAATAASPTLEGLRAEVSKALSQLKEVTERIQTQSDENEALRQEITVLSERLTPTSPSIAA